MSHAGAGSRARAVDAVEYEQRSERAPCAETLVVAEVTVTAIVSTRAGALGGLLHHDPALEVVAPVQLRIARATLERHDDVRRHELFHWVLAESDM